MCPLRKHFPLDEGPDARLPSSLQEVIGEVLRQIAPTVKKGAPGQEQDRLQRVWSDVVGEEIARLTHVKRYRGGVLTVDVESAPLLAELGGFARDSLVEELARSGLTGIHELRLRPGGRSSRPGPDPHGKAGGSDA